MLFRSYAPARPVVSEGDMVARGQMIASAADGLSVPIHASISGKVMKADKNMVVLAAV